MILKWLGLIVGVCFLVAVRYVQHSLFYDPLIDFFHGNFQGQPLPDFNHFLYIINLILRYGLNVLISLGIIAWFFKNRNHVQLSAFVFAVVGLVILPIVIYKLADENSIDHMALFYARRMLMHPILLFVIFPALYYQDLKKEKQ